MIKRSLLITSLATAIVAQTTMCFKKDWQDPSTIEATAMSGGKCAGVNSIEQMKKNGWSIDDIKISSGKNGLDFMYILKKGVVTTLNDSDLETRLNKIQDNREKAKKEAAAKKLAEKKNAEKIARDKKVTAQAAAKKAAPKAAAKKAEAKAKPAAKRAEAKTEAKAEAKPAAKQAEAKTEAKPVAKKAEAKAEEKPAAKTETK